MKRWYKAILAALLVRIMAAVLAGCGLSSGAADVLLLDIPFN